MAMNSITPEADDEGVELITTTYGELLEIAKRRRSNMELPEASPGCTQPNAGRKDSKQHTKPHYQKKKSISSSSRLTLPPKKAHSSSERTEPSQSVATEKSDRKQEQCREGGVLFIKHSKLEEQQSKKPSPAMQRGKNYNNDVSDPYSDLTLLEEKLSGALARWNRQPSVFSRIKQICGEIRDVHLHWLRTSLQSSLKGALASRLWKQTHYVVIEALRTGTAGDTALQEVYVEFLIETCAFYKEIIEFLQKQHCFSLAEITGATMTYSSKEHKNQVSRAKVACHQFYLSLGDLNRYLQGTKPHQDWTLTRSYYTMAQQLAPKIGWTYHQLAVVAINAQKRLDAVYFYVRSLSASLRVLAAREDLLGLLHNLSSKDSQAQRTGGRTESKQRAASSGRTESKQRAASSAGGQGRRKGRTQPSRDRDSEVWIFPTASLEEVKSKLHSKLSPGAGKEEEPRRKRALFTSFSESDPPPKLRKQMVQLFLTVQGKMYTKIQHHTLGAVVETFLEQWQQYLSHALAEEETQRCVMMTTIALFSIHNAADDVKSSGRAHSIGVAAQFLIAMATTVVECCLAAIRLHKEDSLLGNSSAPGGVTRTKSTQETISPNSQASIVALNAHLSVVKVTLDWIYCQEGLFIESLQEVDREVWTLFLEPLSDLLTALAGLEVDSPELQKVALPENRMLLGFVPLSRTLEASWGASVDGSQDSAVQAWTRVACIVSRGRQLCSAGPAWARAAGLHLQCDDDDDEGNTFRCVREQPPQQSGTREAGAGQVSGGERSGRSEPVDCNGQSGNGALTSGGVAVVHSNEKETELLVSRSSTEAQPQSKEGIASEGGSLEPNSEPEVLSTSGSHLKEGVGAGEDKSAVHGRSEEGLHKDLESLQISGKKDGDEGEEEDITVFVDGLSTELESNEDRIESPVDEGIRELRTRKLQLAQELEEHSEAQQRVKDFLSCRGNSESGVRTFIRPKYLVPDTNGFIDHLPSISQLVQSNHYVLTIPLTVVDELSGLSKGPAAAAKDKQKINSTTREGAKVALDTVKGWVDARCSAVRLVTSKGQLMTSLGYSSIERTLAAASNDDFILSSCQSLHLRSVRSPSPEEVLMSVVLLTDDRNLRVKAHAAGLPVRDFRDFLLWSRPLLTSGRTSGPSSSGHAPC